MLLLSPVGSSCLSASVFVVSLGHSRLGRPLEFQDSKPILDTTKDLYKPPPLIGDGGQLGCEGVSGTLWTKSASGSFCSLLPSTQQRVQEVFNRLWRDLARFTGRESLTHSEGIQFLRDWLKGLGISPAFFKETVVAEVFHPYFPDLTNFEDQLALIDTEEKFRAHLLAQPEPPPEQVEKDLKWLKELIPRLRELMIARSKAIPHDPGGAPRKLATGEEKQKVRDEIRELRGPGTKLVDIYARVAQRHGVSASKIKQIWLDRPK